jgi:hypothetical protein
MEERGGETGVMFCKGEKDGQQRQR